MSAREDLEKLQFLLQKVLDEARVDLIAMAKEAASPSVLEAIGDKAERWRRAIARDNPEWDHEVAFRLKQFGARPDRARLVAKLVDPESGFVAICFDRETESVIEGALLLEES